jgi:hypothetical protein
MAAERQVLRGLNRPRDPDQGGWWARPASEHRTGRRGAGTGGTRGSWAGQQLAKSGTTRGQGGGVRSTAPCGFRSLRPGTGGACPLPTRHPDPWVCSDGGTTGGRARQGELPAAGRSASQPSHRREPSSAATKKSAGGPEGTCRGSLQTG